MDKLFDNFQMNNDFFVMLLLFLIITFLISTIIVVFLSKIRALTAMLDKADEIDMAKEDKIAFLDEALQEEKITNLDLKRELDVLEKSKEELDFAKIEIRRLEDKIVAQSKEHVDSVANQKRAFEQLKVDHAELIKSHKELEEGYKLLQKRNESLVSDNNKLHTKIREIQILLKEEERKNMELKGDDA